MKKIGFEAEYFIANASDIDIYLNRNNVEKLNPVIVPTKFPADESGILVEVRGDCGDPYFSVSSFVSEYFRVKDALTEEGLGIIPACRMKINKKLKLELSRGFAKGTYTAQNLYSDSRTHRKHSSYHYAGLHVHFSDNETREFVGKGGRKSIVNIVTPLDIPHIVRKMDEKYRDIIASEYRNPGCYELKSDNFEYRSLPTFWIEELENIESLLSLAKFAFGLMK